MRRPPTTFGDFHCTNCGALVSSAHLLSRVHNRNHCPYCLWSRHLDLVNPGDRLSACKAPMGPIALTTKPGRNKYGGSDGELMLVHFCTVCQSISINRIAADDDPDMLLDVFNTSFTLPARTRSVLVDAGIHILSSESFELLGRQLFGSEYAFHILEAV